MNMDSVHCLHSYNTKKNKANPYVSLEQQADGLFDDQGKKKNKKKNEKK
jgi:hypothetical protein